MSSTLNYRNLQTQANTEVRNPLLPSVSNRCNHSLYTAPTKSPRNENGIDAIEWARRGQDLGVGEILLNSMDADGTKAGFDLDMVRAVRAAVTIPVIASGGAGSPEHFAPAVAAGADAVLAASVFHFGEMTIGDVKSAMAAEGITVR